MRPPNEMSDAEWSATVEDDLADDPFFLVAGSTFPRAQDIGVVSVPRPWSDYSFLGTFGLKAGKAPGPLQWTTAASVMAYGEAVGTVGESPWLSFIPLQKGPTCDTVKLLWCSTCKMKVPVPLRCDSIECPRCHTKWAYQRAGEASQRIHYGYRIHKVEGRPFHLIVRPPAGTIEPTPEGLIAFRRRAEGIAKEHGMEGGCVVLHYGPHTPGIMKRFYPHAHITGVVHGRYTPGPSKEGWLVKFKKVHGPDIYRSLKSLLAYELRHCIRFHNKSHHALVWFGSLSYRAFPGPSEAMLLEMGYKGLDDTLCPVCGTRLCSLDEAYSTEYPGVVSDAKTYDPPRLYRIS